MPLQSGFRITPNWPWIGKMTMTWRHDIIFKFFWHCFVSFVKFSCWPKFHVNIINCSGLTTIYFYKGMTRNLEIGDNPVWVLANIWRLGQFRDAKFSADVPNELLLNSAKCQRYSFYHLWVIKGKPTER